MKEAKQREGKNEKRKRERKKQTKEGRNKGERSIQKDINIIQKNKIKMKLSGREITEVHSAETRTGFYT